MSAGEFQRAVYETNEGNFANLRVQPETLAAVVDSVANAEAVGTVNQEASAQVSKGKRNIGINARTVTLKFTATPPDGYSGDPVTIPALTPAFYTACNPNSNTATGTYLGVAVRAVGRSPEKVR
jgi:hypothetical protein